MISRFFIDRPVFASVISVVIVLLGGMAYFRLPVAQYPDLAPPVVRVEALYPGAAAQIVADTVAAPLEQEINGVDRMIYMTSTSSESRYGLDISFEPGTDVDLAAVLVQNRVNIAEPKLPEEVRRLGVTTRKQSTAMIGVISLSSPGGGYDDLFLANYLSINVKDEIARIHGVGGTTVIPAKDYSMRVWLDPLKLKARNLTVADVAAAIRAQNVQVAAGAIGRQPAPAGTDFELIVSTKGRLDRPEEFAEIIVKRGEGGALVHVHDVGRVELGTRDYTTRSTFDGKPNAILVVYQLPGANLVEVAERVRAKVAELPGALPAGVRAEFFYDSSMFITAALHEVQKTLLEAFVLVFLVVLLFLQSWRTTIIPTITIPVSLIGTFLLLLAFGFSVNMLTMFGLVLAIGIVVDDAIVVVENVERNMREYLLPPREATIRAMQEITGPVIAITLVLMSVFLPSAALPGITGEMYRQFALTIAASTAFSAVNALTLSPALCALLLKPHAEHHRTFPLFLPLKRLGDGFNVLFDGVTRVYVGIVRFLNRTIVVALAAFFVVLIGSWWLFLRTPTGFVPEEDLGFVVVAAQLPDGASLERTNAVIDRIGEVVTPVDGVARVITLSGFSVLEGNGPTVGNAWLVLDDWDERAHTGRDVNTIMNDIRAALREIQEAEFVVFGLPPIQGLGNASGFDMRLQDRQALGRDALQAAVDDVLRAANGQTQIAFAYTGYRAAVPQLYLDIDREKVLRMDIPLPSVFETLQTALGSAYINDFNLFNRTYQVNVQADYQFRQSPADILRLEVRSARGEMIPLGAFTTVQESFGAERVNRYNLYPSATINGAPAPGASSGDALATMEQVAADQLPRGVQFEWTAMSYQEKQAGGKAALTFGLGLLMVYLILAAQYESWITPLSVVLSVPLVVAGALLALQCRGLDNNVFTQIGLVLLIGLGAKNAILIVEFAMENRRAGKGILESALEGARTRFRPILMTSFAFILGVVPLLTATGAGAASRRALGTAVFGGMVGGTLLGVLLIPSLFVIIEWLRSGLVRPAASRAAPAGVEIPTMSEASSFPAPLRETPSEPINRADEST